MIARFSHPVSCLAAVLLLLCIASLATAQNKTPDTQAESDPVLVSAKKNLASGNPDERLDAVLTISNFNQPENGPLLESALNDSYPEVRAAAIAGLADLGDARYVQPIGALIEKDKSPLVRQQCAYALGRFDDPAAIPYLLKDLRDKEPEVRGAAVLSLEKKHDPSAIGPLIQALGDNSEFVRCEATLALASNSAGTTEALPLIIKLLRNDKSNTVKAAAAQALGIIGSAEAIPALESTSRSFDPYLSSAAITALELVKKRSQLR